MRKSALLLLTITFIGNSCKTAGPTSAPPHPGPSRLARKDINAFTGLAVSGWRFFWRPSAELGYPVEAFLRLSAERDGEVVQVECPEDVRRLYGFRITRADQALDFVRLFASSSACYHLWMSDADAYIPKVE